MEADFWLVIRESIMLVIHATSSSRTRLAMIQRETNLMRMMKIPRLMLLPLKRTRSLGLRLRVGSFSPFFEYCPWLDD